MDFLYSIPIKRKLIFICVFTSGIVLLLACAAFFTYEQFTFRQTMRRDLETTARMLGLNSAAALAFDDPLSAERTLQALEAHPNVMAARIYDPEGQHFASYQKDPGTDAHWPSRIVPGYRFTEDHLELFHSIEFMGDTIGIIYLQYDLQPMYARVARYAEIALGVLFASVLIAFLIASRLQRVISEPLLQLAETAARVGAEKDYSLRAPRRSEDELGLLVDRFNEMLAQIQQRDANLQNARAELEKRVEERTADLKVARLEAEREKALFKFIFDSVPVGISWRDASKEAFPIYNAAHERITGVTMTETTNKNVFGHVTHPEDFKRQQEFHQQINCGEIDHFSLEKRYIHADGKVVWVVFSYHLFPDPGTGANQIVTTLVDITDLKQAHEEAVREHARFKFIFESVPVGISWAIPGQEGTYLSNPAHRRITGLQPEEAATPGAFEAITHPEDFKQETALSKKLEAGQIDRFSLEKRYRHPDGPLVWVSMTRRVFLDPSGFRQDVVTLVDITDRKRTTDELDRIFTLSQDMICTVGFDGFFKRINPAFENILGYAKEELLARPVIDFIDPADRDDFLQDQERLATSLLSASFENRYICRDETTRWVQWKVVSVESEKLFYCVIRDVSKQKEDAAELEEMHKRLIDASRQAGMAEVATGVLHNVGNVLNSINVSATVISDKVRGAKAGNIGRVSQLLSEHKSDLGNFITRDERGRQIPGYLSALADLVSTENGEILRELDQMGRNLDHIKDIVAMQQSYAKRSGYAETLSVADLFEDALRMNAGALARHDVNLVRDFQARPVVTVEKHKVLQILVNIIRNAKYACDASGRADKTITARITANHGRVQMSIIDNGIGIEQKNLSRIFNHGFTTRKDGHGFGLHSGALSATEIDGSLEAFSEGKGKGSTFVLDFPLQPERPDK